MFPPAGERASNFLSREVTLEEGGGKRGPKKTSNLVKGPHFFLPENLLLSPHNPSLSHPRRRRPSLKRKI